VFSEWPRQRNRGLLADRPSDFAAASSFVLDPHRATLPFEMTNKGLHFHLPILELDHNTCLAIFDFHDMDQSEYSLGLNLVKSETSSDTFYLDHPRIRYLEAGERENLPMRSVYVSNRVSLAHQSLIQTAELENFFFELSFMNSQIMLQEIKRGFPLTSSAPLSQTNGQFFLPNSSENISTQPFSVLVFNDGAQNVFGVFLKITPRNFELRVVNNIDMVEIYRVFRDIMETRRDDMGELPPDRFLWQHPVGKWWISVGTKRTIASGKRSIIVTIKDVLR